MRSQMAVIYDAKVAEVKRLSEALLMLDTSRIEQGDIANC